MFYCTSPPSYTPVNQGGACLTLFQILSCFLSLKECFSPLCLCNTPWLFPSRSSLWHSISIADFSDILQELWLLEHSDWFRTGCDSYSLSRYISIFSLSHWFWKEMSWAMMWRLCAPLFIWLAGPFTYKDDTGLSQLVDRRSWWRRTLDTRNEDESCPT